MILGLEIAAGVVVIVVAFFLGRRRKPGAAPDARVAAQAPGQEAPKKSSRKITDTSAFRQYAQGDIDHDAYTEIVEGNIKDGK